MKHKGVLILLAVMVVQGLVVARVFTPRPHSGGDNAGYVSLAHSILHRSAYLELWDPDEPPHTKYPPVFPVLLAGAMVLGAKGWVGLKLVPALSMVLAVGFTYLWAGERRGPVFGLLVALLFGLSNAAVYYSAWVLSDPSFLALTFAGLWAFQRASGLDASGSGGSQLGFSAPEGVVAPASFPADDRSEGRSWSVAGRNLWLGLGVAMAGLAYLTRSAGIPLLVAVLLWLALARRWKALIASGLALGIPALLWWFRGFLVGGGDYVSEFWLIDPYFPDLGRVGVADLFRRVAENLSAYGGAIIPSGIVGGDRPALALLGIVLAALCIVGWARSVLDKLGVAEIFTPLYLALILLWPTSWSGDRFALPLFPLIFYYAGVSLAWFLKGVGPKVRIPVVAGLVAVLALPAAQVWDHSAKVSQACREATERGTPGRCFTPAEEEYFALAEWARENLPGQAVVVTRKPRIFYAMSGIKSKSIPLSMDTDVFFVRAQESGSEYLSIDRLDSMSQYYLFPVLRDHPERFCSIGGLGGGEQAWTQLFGIVDSDPGLVGEVERSEAFPLCPATMLRPTPRSGSSAGSWAIPILAQARDSEN